MLNKTIVHPIIITKQEIWEAMLTDHFQGEGTYLMRSLKRSVKAEINSVRKDLKKLGERK